MNWFKQARPGLKECLLKCPIAGDLEGNVIRVYRVHFAIVKIDLHIHDPVAGEDTLAAGVPDSTLDRWDIYAIHALPGERLPELNARIARCRRYTQRYLAELPCTTRLLLVTIIRFGGHFDRLAKAHAWLQQIEVDIEPAAKPFCHDVKMQLALRGDDRLAQFGVCGEDECRILLVQRGKTRSNLVFFALGLGLERGVKRRLRINRRWQLYRSACQAECVARVGVFELNRRPDVTSAELIYRCPIAAIEEVNLTYALSRATHAVQQVHPGPYPARVHSEEPHLA